MAAQTSTSGADVTAGETRRRNVAQPNGNANYVPKQVAGKMDEKTKQKVCR